MSKPDLMETIIEDALKENGINFTRDNADNTLDFTLTQLGVHIECKRYYSERTIKQLARHKNVILIQGLGAAAAFADMLRR